MTVLDAALRRITPASTVLLLAAVSVIASGQPAAAAVGGSFELTAICNYDGSGSSSVWLHEHFTGLDTGSVAYAAAASHGTGDNTVTTDDSGYWYAEPDGTHEQTTYETSYSQQASYTIQAGQSFDWVLQRIQGGTTTALSGTTTVAPCAPNFSSSPSKVTVHSRDFTYGFAASKGAAAKVKVTKDGTTLAVTSLTVPKDGTANAKLTLTRKAWHHLKNVGSESTRVTVTCTKAGESTSAHTALTLKAPA